MHLGTTPYEVIIDASSLELAAFRARITALSPGERIQCPVFAKHWPEGVANGTSLTITCTTGPFLAVCSKDGSLVIDGNATILKDFAATFDFGPEVHAGAHTHWDLAGLSDDVHEDSVPLVVQVA